MGMAGGEKRREERGERREEDTGACYTHAPLIGCLRVLGSSLASFALMLLISGECGEVGG
jgi:hypothetical protein